MAIIERMNNFKIIPEKVPKTTLILCIFDQMRVKRSMLVHHLIYNHDSDVRRKGYTLKAIELNAIKYLSTSLFSVMPLHKVTKVLIHDFDVPI